MFATTVAGRLGGSPGGRLLDVAAAVAASVATVVLIRHGGVDPARTVSRELDALGVTLAVCSVLPLLAWRRSPVAAFTSTAAVTAVLAGLGYPVDLTPAATVAVFLLALGRAPGGGSVRAAVAAVGAALAVCLAASGLARQALPASELLHTGLAWALAWFVGERVRLWRREVAELQERTRRAEREVDRERLLAVAEERARIARDLHDSAGHAISLIAVRAGAARLRHRDPARTVAALTAIEDIARRTVGEIDQLVGTLRTGPAGELPAPVGLASLDTVVAAHAEAGLAVSVRSSGDPRPFGGAADQAAYRIVQQALTNAAQHGAPTADVELSFTADAVAVTVTNPTVHNGRPRPGGGNGLVGMRERATLLGGTFEAGAADGTFRVRARIPYGGRPWSGS
jgi:signal transduction histidine kinase